MDYRQAAAHALEQIPERTEAAVIADEVFYEDLLELGINEELAANIMLRYADARISTSEAVLDRAIEYGDMIRDEKQFLDYATRQIRRDERKDVLTKHSIALYISIVFNIFMLFLLGSTRDVFKADLNNFFNAIGTNAYRIYRDLLKTVDMTALAWLIIIVAAGIVVGLMWLLLRWFIRKQADRYSLIIAAFSLAISIFFDEAIGQIGNVILLWIMLQIVTITIRGIVHRIKNRGGIAYGNN